MNRRGENGSSEGIAFTDPSAMSSLINNPVTGAQRMPQQLWPYAQTTFAVPGTRPSTGIASGAQGRMQACSILGFCPRANGAMPWKDATAAATPVWRTRRRRRGGDGRKVRHGYRRSGFAFMSDASWRSPPSRSRAPLT